MNSLKKEITEAVKTQTPSVSDCCNVLKYKDLVCEREIEVEYPDCKKTFTVEIWTKALQSAIDENERIYIPNMGKVIYIDDSLVLHSGCAIIADEKQEIALAPDSGVCFVKNRSIINGGENSVSLNNPDTDICVVGGIWNALTTKKNVANGNRLCRFDKENSIKGVFCLMLFSNVKDIVIKNLTMKQSHSYAVQICNCEGFFIDNIVFESYHKDGIHVNGPAKYGIISNLSGQDMGDDMVALNAWDWNSSAMTFGTIEKLLVDNIESTQNELRLLPGRKTYESGEITECDIKDCIIQNIKGIYTFKLYAQPNIYNAISGIHDVSETVGRIYNVYFSNILFPNVRTNGFGTLPVKGLFEICSDCTNLYFDNIKVNNSKQEFSEKNISFIKVGPLSCVWTNGSDDPSKWGEVFSPDDICTADKLFLKDIFFDDERATSKDSAILVKAIRLTVNEDYPNTKPRGGTGYGIVKEYSIV